MGAGVLSVDLLISNLNKRSQVVQEILSENAGVLEPLRWAVHGGPGTGKSYVLNRLRKELFEDIWAGSKVMNSKS